MITRLVLTFDKVGFRFGRILALGDSKRGVFIRLDDGALTYAHNSTYGTFWWLSYIKPCKTIPLKYDLTRQRQ